MTDAGPMSRFVDHLIREIRVVDSRGACLVGPNHAEPAIKGHIIPRNRLELIAERRDSNWQAVRTFTMGESKLRARAAGKLADVRDEPDVEQVNIRNPRITCRFACAPHDRELFSPVDGAGLDASNPEHCALMSYRTLLYIQREALAYVDALCRVQHSVEFRALKQQVRHSIVERGKRACIEAYLADKAPNCGEICRWAPWRGWPLPIVHCLWPDLLAWPSRERSCEAAPPSGRNASARRRPPLLQGSAHRHPSC